MNPACVARCVVRPKHQHCLQSRPLKVQTLEHENPQPPWMLVPCIVRDNMLVMLVGLAVAIQKRDRKWHSQAHENACNQQLAHTSISIHKWMNAMNELEEDLCCYGRSRPDRFRASGLSRLQAAFELLKTSIDSAGYCLW